MPDTSDSEKKPEQEPVRPEVPENGEPEAPPKPPEPPPHSVEAPAQKPPSKLKKLESSLKRQSQALERIAESKAADPTVRATASVMAAELRSLQIEVSIALTEGRVIPDTKLDQIKRKKREVEKRNVETKATALFAKAAVSHAEKKAQQPDTVTQNEPAVDDIDENKFLEALDEAVEKSISGGTTDRAETVSKLQELLEDVLDEEAILSLITEDSLELKQLLDAIANRAIDINDISPADLAEALTPATETGSPLLEDPAPDALELLFGESFMKEIKDTIESMTSDEYVHVRNRTEQVTFYLDKVLSRVNADMILTEDDIDLIFLRFNLLPELARNRAEEKAKRNTTQVGSAGSEISVVPNIERNYAEAEIVRETYKTILTKRNAKILMQQRIRLGGISADDDQFDIERDVLTGLESPQIAPTEQIREITDLIKKYEKDSEGDEALKGHFLSKIQEEVIEISRKTEKGELPQLEGEVTISRDEESGYYILTFSNRSDFDRLTMSDGTALGAAYKSENVFLICQDGIHHPSEDTLTASDTDVPRLPSLQSIARHEIAHLEFEDEREVSLERETVFTAHKIVNIIQSTGSSQSKRDMLEKVYAILRSDEIDHNAIISTFSIDPMSRNPQKIEGLVNYFKKKRALLLSEDNNLGRKSLQVEELAAEMSDTMMNTEGRLTLASLGLTRSQAENFSIYNEHNDEQSQASFNTHNVEAINMLRILNQAIPHDTSPEERQKLLEKWAGRIMKFDEFNVTNTLSFIFELVNQDGINLEDVFPSSETPLDKNSTEGKYLRFSSRYKDGAFRTYVLDQLNRGKLDHKNIQSEEQLKKLIDYAYNIYSSIVLQRLEDREDISTPDDIKDREVENELFKFASRPMFDGLVNLHNNEGRVLGSPYADAPRGYFFADALGLDPKSQYEKGLRGRNSSLVPVKMGGLLPFGWGENERIKKALNANPIFKGILKAVWGVDQLIEEGETKENFRRRAGEWHLDMDIQDMHSLMVDRFVERLKASKHYIDPVQIFTLLFHRIGLAYSSEGQIIPTYKALTLQKDEYLAEHLYVKTDPNGNLIPPPPANEGFAIYTNLRSKGYSGRDLHLLMEAHNPNQQFVDSSGNSVIAPAGYPIKLGTVTARTAERTKMMRFGGKKGPQHIAEGKAFDEISRWIMKLQADSFANSESYSLEDVFRAIDEVDNIKPGDPSVDTVEKFKKIKSKVTLAYQGSSREFDREMLKEYVRCFYYGRTYEAMALGVYGDQEVVRITSSDANSSLTEHLFEFNEAGYTILTPKQKEDAVNDFMHSWQHAIHITKANFERGGGSFVSLQPVQRQQLLEQTRAALMQQLQGKGLSVNMINATDIPQGAVTPTTTLTEGQIYTFKKPGKDIYIRLPGQPMPKIVKAHDGLTKDEMNREFRDFAHTDPGGDPDSYSLPGIDGKLINSVEDVIFEKSQINAQYFYLRQLIKQMENYVGKSSAKKEKWVGIARAFMLARWIHTALFITAAIAFPPALAGMFVNPFSIAALLANYFIIGNYTTKQGELWGKRKVAGIQAANKIRELEPYFEEAFFDPTFSSGPKRARLLNILKNAVEIAKSAKVTTVDTPENVLEGWTKTALGTVKEAID